jgi:penicillin-binding protein 2
MGKQNKIYLFLGFLIIAFLILAARLFELQIIFGDKNRALAEGNRIRKEILPAPRGMIYDRNGKELVRNVPIYRKMSNVKCQMSNVKCFEIISREEALKMEAEGREDELRVDIGREYLYGEALAHVLGYLGEVNAEEVKSGRYKLGDLVGRMGIEQEYDEILRGQDGGEIYEVDSQGRKIREIGKIEPVPGKDLYLSLDAELAKTAYESLEKKLGAVVASDPQNGQILILVSSPSFDPNIMMDKLKDQGSQKLEALLNDQRKPFFNRAVSGVYPPGSTFKIVTAVAGLEEGKIDDKTTWNDTGEIKVGDYSYKNWYFTQYGKTEGEINLVRAIKRSTDTFFYKVGEWVGPQKLSEWAKAFGLGRKTGIDLPGEASGLVPSPEWKQKIGGHWFLGNTYHFAIGQGDILATPLQINMMTNIIANGGKLCKPAVRQKQNDNSKFKTEEICQDLKLKTTTLALVKEGMEEACSPGGTAFPFFDFQPRVACKTGTAEFGDLKNRTHAWFTVFAPAVSSDGEPQITITTILEGEGEGSYAAAPVAKKILEAWFNER